MAAIFCTGGVSMRGLGATTGVAWLLMFLGAEPPSFSLGFACCCAGGGGGGGGGGFWPISITRRTDCGSARSIFPEICRKASSIAAFTAAAAMIAPLLCFASRSDRYMPRVNAIHARALR